MTPCEDKMLYLAQRDAGLQALLGGPTIFRWFDRQLLQGQIDLGPCVTVLRVSTQSVYSQSGALANEWIRFQIDCLSLQDPTVARQLAFAVATWFGTVSFMSSAQFLSPPTTPPNFPNFVNGPRAGLKAQLGKPVYVESLDCRVANNLNF
jgi:hypothetical protein